MINSRIMIINMIINMIIVQMFHISYMYPI